MRKVKAELVPKKAESLDGELAELCRMMRLMSERDIDATLVQVLKVMMVAGREKPVGGSELARVSGLNRITILHHLRRLEEAGFVARTEGKYMMRVRSAEEMIAEFRKEMEEMLAEMDELASRIDEQFGEVLGRHKELRRKLLR